MGVMAGYLSLLSYKSKHVLMVPVFFFFKQKTAYEMRISDWSSDVCSSDLSAADMRRHPIGTGPFKFADFQQNQFIKLTKNENYWEEGRPYLDGIEFTIIRNRSTRSLAFIAGDFDKIGRAHV